jgi:hypothetical protein
LSRTAQLLTVFRPITTQFIKGTKMKFFSMLAALGLTLMAASVQARPAPVLHAATFRVTATGTNDSGRVQSAPLSSRFEQKLRSRLSEIWGESPAKAAPIPARETVAA